MSLQPTIALALTSNPMAFGDEEMTGTGCVQCLLLTALGLLIGCDAQAPATGLGSPSTEARGSDSASLSLDPVDLEKLSSWESTSQASAKLTESLADIMSEVTDPESANAAIPKLRALAPKFAAISRAEKTFGEPSEEDRKLVLRNLASVHRKFDKFYSSLMEQDELKAIVGQAIDDAYVGNVIE